MSLFFGTVLAAVIGAILNLILLAIGKPLVGLTGVFTPLSAGPVITWSIIGALGAGIVFAIIRKYSRMPKRSFKITAIVVLLLSFIPDVLIMNTRTGPFAGATWPAVILLMLMYVVVALVVLRIFIKKVRPKSTSD